MINSTEYANKRILPILNKIYLERFQFYIYKRLLLIKKNVTFALQNQYK